MNKAGMFTVKINRGEQHDNQPLEASPKPACCYRLSSLHCPKGLGQPLWRWLKFYLQAGQGVRVAYAKPHKWPPMR